MPERHHKSQGTSAFEESFFGLLKFSKPTFFSAVRKKLKEGYSVLDFKADVMSSLVVMIVAIPLGMALAIASGVAPQHGLYTIILAGAIVPLLGGSRFQVTGPTAAFVVILAPIAAKYGLGGLLTAGLMAGFILLCMGLARMGRLIQFIPYPVTTGFTTGIATVIATLQLKDFLGLEIQSLPDHYLGKVHGIVSALPTLSWASFGVGTVTFLLLVVWPRLNKKIPAPLIVLGLMSVATVIIKWKFPDVHIDTIATKFSEIPGSAPKFSLPWLYGADHFSISWESIEFLIPSAFAIAMLGAIESLLSAVIADGMAQTKHDPDAELIALGIGNILCPFFGGIAATGAIARTATNIRFGAKSPFSASLHGLLTLVTVLLFAPYIAYLPMAALSALLLVVAYNMSEIRHFRHILRVGPRSDVAVLLVCFVLTVIFDMVMGVTTGIVLASLLFMKRMATFTSTEILPPQSVSKNYHVPSDVLLYDINGPLFFGAAQKAMETIDSIKQDIRIVFLLMEDVPVMDVSGLVALESTIKELIEHKRKIYLIGANPQPSQLILRSNISKQKDVYIFQTVEAAIQHYKNT